MSKKFIIRVSAPGCTGHVFSETSSVARRIERLKQNVDAVNDRNNGRKYDRFNVFLGAPTESLVFDVYKKM